MLSPPLTYEALLRENERLGQRLKEAEEDALECRKLMQGLLAQQREPVRRQDDSLAGWIHDLRNVLAPIHNAVLLLRKLELADPQLQRLRDIIDGQVARLVRLVDDVDMSGLV